MNTTVQQFEQDSSDWTRTADPNVRQALEQKLLDYTRGRFRIVASTAFLLEPRGTPWVGLEPGTGQYLEKHYGTARKETFPWHEVGLDQVAVWRIDPAWKLGHKRWVAIVMLQGKDLPEAQGKDPFGYFDLEAQ